MSENIEIRAIITNRNANVNSVSDTPVTDPASGAKVCNLGGFCNTLQIIEIIAELPWKHVCSFVILKN